MTVSTGLDMIDEKYTVRGAAQVLDVVTETVRRYIREGSLQAEKIRVKGKKEVWLIDAADIERFRNGGAKRK